MIQSIRNRFEYLNALVGAGNTGCPKQLAEKLGLSERAWYKLRDELVHDSGIPLRYSPERQTYCYAQPGELLFQFQHKLDDDSLEKLNGGWTVHCSLY